MYTSEFFCDDGQCRSHYPLFSIDYPIHSVKVLIIIERTDVNHCLQCMTNIKEMQLTTMVTKRCDLQIQCLYIDMIVMKDTGNLTTKE